MGSIYKGGGGKSSNLVNNVIYKGALKGGKENGGNSIGWKGKGPGIKTDVDPTEVVICPQKKIV